MAAARSFLLYLVLSVSGLILAECRTISPKYPVVTIVDGQADPPWPAPNKTVHFKVSGGKQELTIKPGYDVVVTFEGTPSTGYMWKLLSPLDFVHMHWKYDPAADATHQDKPPDNFQFHFHNSCCDTEQSLEFGYARAWGSAPPVQNATLDVTIEDP